MELQPLIDALRAEFPKHHLQVSVWPSGGEIDADACEECGSAHSSYAMWRYDKAGKLNSLDQAVAKLKADLAALESMEPKA